MRQSIQDNLLQETFGLLEMRKIHVKDAVARKKRKTLI